MKAAPLKLDTTRLATRFAANPRGLAEQFAVRPHTTLRGTTGAVAPSDALLVRQNACAVLVQPVLPFGELMPVQLHFVFETFSAFIRHGCFPSLFHCTPWYGYIMT